MKLKQLTSLCCDKLKMQQTNKLSVIVKNILKKNNLIKKSKNIPLNTLNYNYIMYDFLMDNLTEKSLYKKIAVREIKNLDNSKQEEKKINKNQFKENSENFIKKYLKPNKKTLKNIKITFNELLEEIKLYDKEYIKNYIKNKLKYNEFLMTTYWKVISIYVREKANNRCQLCNSSEKLRVHHRCYKNHGVELLNTSDLICLCERCHHKFHNIK